MTSQSNKDTGQTASSWIIYDGECPYCRNYVRFVKLREAIGAVDMINARDGGEKVKQAQARGYDLNEGMIFYHENTYHYGADAINMMALMSTSSTVFNRLNKFLFKSPKLARITYPVLRACRNITLKILRRKKISS